MFVIAGFTDEIKLKIAQTGTLLLQMLKCSHKWDLRVQRGLRSLREQREMQNLCVLILCFSELLSPGATWDALF